MTTIRSIGKRLLRSLHEVCPWAVSRDEARARLKRWKIHAVTVPAWEGGNGYATKEIDMRVPRPMVLHGIQTVDSAGPDLALTMLIQNRYAFDHLSAWVFNCCEPAMAIPLEIGQLVCLRVESKHGVPVDFAGGHFLVTFTDGAP